MRYLPILLVIIIFTMSYSAAFSQVGVTGYSDYALGIHAGSGSSKGFHAELKTFANRDMEHVDLEIDLLYTFYKGAHHSFSAGLGLNGTPFRENYLADVFAKEGFSRDLGWTIPAIMEIRPIEEVENLSILFELAPHFQGETGTRLRGLWGIRYTFND